MEGHDLRSGRTRDGQAPTRPSVALLEIDHDGHRLRYLRLLAQAAGVPDCVVLTSRAATVSDEYATHMRGTEATVIEIGEVGSPKATLRAALEQAEELGVRCLIIPDGDLYLVPLLAQLIRRIRSRVTVRLLLMRTAEIGGLERLRFATLAKPVLVQLVRALGRTETLFLTDALGIVNRRRGYPGVRPVRDPVEPLPHRHPVARPAWFPPVLPGTVLIGVFGLIGARKNVPLLLAALESASSAVLVVAGRLEPETKKLLTGKSAEGLVSAGRLVVRDSVLPAAEYAAALSAVDAVAVLHDNDTPSGVMAEACLSGTPALVPLGGWLARIVNEAGVGVATALTPRDVADAIEEVGHRRRELADALRRYGTRLGTADFIDGLLGR